MSGRASLAEGHRRLALRARVSAAFALVGLLLTLVLAITTYLLARTYMLDQRENVAIQQAFLNARLAASLLDDVNPSPQAVLGSLQGGRDTVALLRVDDRWYSSTVAASPADIPAEVRQVVAEGDGARQRLTVAGDPRILVGIPLGDTGGQYYELASLRELERTLRILLGSLAVASTITTAAGAGVGWYASRRLLRPLRRVSQAAVDIASGDLDTRLDDEGDADLEALVTSFNEMAAALQLRIEREARFASDVSHELRTPLTALATAVQVVRGRVDTLPERTRLAVDVLETQIAYFERLVLDLLEISRFDAGASELAVEVVDVVQLVEEQVAAFNGVVVAYDHDMARQAWVDPRRVQRVLVNLLENAEQHGGGATRVGVAWQGPLLVLEVDDDGPGIPDEDRERVFDRFWRGRGSRQAAAKGTGLGLSLVAEHVRLHGGRVRVEGPATGGCRVVVELPADRPADAPGREL